jgi:hypothetical protein
MFQKPRFKQEPIGLNVVPAHSRDLSDVAVSSNAPDVHDEVNRKSDGFADAPMWQPDVRCQYALGQACQGLFCGVRVDRAETAEMSGVQRLQQVERFGARTSPTRMRSGRCRRAARSRSAIVTGGSGASWPSAACARLASSRTTFGLLR